MARNNTCDGREQAFGCGRLTPQLKNKNGPDGALTPLPGPNHTHFALEGGAAVHKPSYARSALGTTLPNLTQAPASTQVSA